MADRVISSTGPYTGYDAALTIDGATDWFLMQQAGVYKKINRQTILGVSGSPADISTVQSFTNKTLNNTNTITLLDTLFTLQDNSDNTKQIQFQLSGLTTATTRTLTVPDANLTIVGVATTQTLTNKTLTAPAITGGSITNTTISVDAIAKFTAANGVTIDGLNIKDGKLNTNNSVVTANITDLAVTPAKMNFGASYAEVLTSQTTTATSPADLSTVGPAVTVIVPASGSVLLTFWAKGFEDGSSRANMGVALSGANTVAADANSSHVAQTYWDDTETGTIGLSFLLTGLAAGSTTFTAKYWGVSGTKTFSDRMISVIPIGD